MEPLATDPLATKSKTWGNDVCVVYLGVDEDNPASDLLVRVVHHRVDEPGICFGYTAEEAEDHAALLVYYAHQLRQRQAS